LTRPLPTDANTSPVLKSAAEAGTEKTNPVAKAATEAIEANLEKDMAFFPKR